MMKKFLGCSLAALLAFAAPARATNDTSWATGAGNTGAGLTWYSAGFTTATDFNSLANGSCVAARSAIANGTALDLYADISGTLTVGGTTATTSYLSFYVVPLNQDGSTYGDGLSYYGSGFTGSTAPAAVYLAPPAVGVTSGITSGNAITWTLRGIVIPPGSFIWVVCNNLGVALNSTAAATVQQRTYRENLNN